MRVWDLMDAEKTAEEAQVQYTNAKVLLVGESGAGKTGLSMRLALNEWKASDSTVGAWARRIEARQGREGNRLQRRALRRDERSPVARQGAGGWAPGLTVGFHAGFSDFQLLLLIFLTQWMRYVSSCFTIVHLYIVTFDSHQFRNGLITFDHLRIQFLSEGRSGL